METGEPKFRCPLCGGEMWFKMITTGGFCEFPVPRVGLLCIDCGYTTI